MRKITSVSVEAYMQEQPTAQNFLGFYTSVLLKWETKTLLFNLE